MAKHKFKISSVGKSFKKIGNTINNKVIHPVVKTTTRDIKIIAKEGGKDLRDIAKFSGKEIDKIVTSGTNAINNVSSAFSSPILWIAIVGGGIYLLSKK